MHFAAGALARSDRKNRCEDRGARFGDTFSAVDDAAAIDVDVVLLAIP